MSRVKFNINTEYAYIHNFKILQSMFLPVRRVAPLPSPAHTNPAHLQTRSPSIKLTSLSPSSPL